MIDAERVLQPLDDVRSALDRLYHYRTPQELGDALIELDAAVLTSLRLLLRSHPDAPESLRLRALSEDQLPADAALESLRSHDLISIELAGGVHELSRIAQRARAGEVHAADADRASDVARRLRAEVQSHAERPLRESAHHVVEDERLDETPHTVQAASKDWRPAGALVAVLVILAALVAGYLLFAGGDPMEEGVAAFGQDRMGIAENRFEEALAADSANVTAMLYLARIYRRQDRMEAARDVLEQAARTAPGDADVRRELGHFLYAGARYDAAADQYRQALELESEEPLNWMGLIRALRALGDPRADDLLRQAPASVRTAFENPSPNPE